MPAASLPPRKNRGTKPRLSGSDRVYWTLLALYPKAHRERFGADMLDVFRDLRHSCGRRGGRRVLLWASELRQLLALAGGERLRLAKRRLGGRLVPRRRKSIRQWGEESMQSIWNDLRYALRGFARQPLFSLVAVLTLGLAIGANSAIFSLVNGILLKPLDYPGSERIVMIWEDFSAQGGPEQEWLEVPNYFIWKRQADTFEAMSVYGGFNLNLEAEGEAEQLSAAAVSHDFFRIFAIEPALGRSFIPEEDVPGAPRVAVVSNELWQRRFGGDPGLLGSNLMLSGEPYSVIGILPPGFEVAQFGRADVWTPARLDESRARRGNFYLMGIGRLKESASLEQADLQMNGIMQQIGQEHPENRGTRIQLVPLRDQIVGPAKAGLWALLGASGLVLLIGCANIANLMLSKGAARRRELSIRAAMGAGRLRVSRQLLTESALLSSIGGLLGLAVALAGMRGLVALAPPGTPRIGEVSIDLKVLFFTLAVSILTGLIFGLAPVFQASSTDVNASLSVGGRSHSSAGASPRLRGLLVVAEVAFALLLMVGSGLLVRSFGELMQVDLGFRPQHLTAAQIQLPRSGYEEPSVRTQLFDSVLEGLRAQPGIEAATAVSVLPLSGRDSDVSFYIEGRPLPQNPQDVSAIWYRRVQDDYFRTMGIPLLDGRAFTAQDRADAPRVGIISRNGADRFFPGEDPVGRRFKFSPEPDAAWTTIVGVAAGVRHTGVEREPRPELYLPFAQRPSYSLAVVVRDPSGPASAAAKVRTVMEQADPRLPVGQISSLEELVDRSVAQPRFVMGLASGFSLLALALAVVGIYGVSSYSVSSRTYEMGLRMALGAQRARVLRLVLAHGLILALVGVAVGLSAALGLSRLLLSSLLFGVSPTDLGTYLSVSTALCLAALGASLLPALRATRIDPLLAIRCE